MIGPDFFLIFRLPILWERSRAVFDIFKPTPLLRTSRTMLSVPSPLVSSMPWRSKQFLGEYYCWASILSCHELNRFFKVNELLFAFNMHIFVFNSLFIYIHYLCFKVLQTIRENLSTTQRINAFIKNKYALFRKQEILFRSLAYLKLLWRKHLKNENCSNKANFWFEQNPWKEPINKHC